MTRSRPPDAERAAPRLLLVSTVALTLEAFLLPLAERLRSRGWRVDGAAHAVSQSRPCVAAFDTVHDIAWSRNPWEIRAWQRSQAQVRGVVQHGAHDVVHVHTPVAGFLTRAAFRRIRLRCPRPRIVYTAHGFHFHEGGGFLRNAAFRALERQAGRWTDRLVVINREDDAAARHFMPIERIALIPGVGIDVERYRGAAEAGAQLRSNLGIAAGERLCTVVAEFTPNKRQGDVVRALGLLPRVDLHVAFAGIGPREDHVKALARSLKLEGRTHFLGFRQDVAALLAASDALVLPSEREGLPRAVLEAMSAGVPVIGTDVRGTRELLADGAGIIVPVGDPAGIAAGLRLVLEDPSAVLRMVRRATERLPRYQLDRILDLHEALYQDVLRDRGVTVP